MEVFLPVYPDQSSAGLPVIPALPDCYSEYSTMWILTVVVVDASSPFNFVSHTLSFLIISHNF
jgi:hypothetical protein